MCVFSLRPVFLRCWCWLIFIYFSSLPSLFRFRFGHRLYSSWLFLVGTMLSPRFRFLLRLVLHIICILIRTYADLSILVWGIRFVSVIVCIIFCFYLFSSWGDLHLPLQSYWELLRVIGACPVAVRTTTSCNIPAMIHLVPGRGWVRSATEEDAEHAQRHDIMTMICLLYTSDAADE